MTKTRSVTKGPSGWMMRASGTLATLSLLAAGVPGCEGQNDPAQAITGSAQAGRESKVRMDMKSIADALSADFLMSQQWPSGDDAAAGLEREQLGPQHLDSEPGPRVEPHAERDRVVARLERRRLRLVPYRHGRAG